MMDTDKPQGRKGGAPSRPKATEGLDKDLAKTGADDRPRWEDELLGEFLQNPSPEGQGSQEEKGVVPGKKKPG